MLQAATGVLFVLLLAWVFVIGMRAVRTKKLAMIGLVPAGCSLGAFAWSVFSPEFDLAMRVATGSAAIAAGVAHGVWFSLVALPPRKVWLRMVLVPIGMWFGTFASLWFVLPYQGTTLKVFVAVL
ncbi:MAG: hypothetical protein ACRETX_12410, partial [Steroidobacteraceae bacterium]